MRHAKVFRSAFPEIPDCSLKVDAFTLSTLSTWGCGRSCFSSFFKSAKLGCIYPVVLCALQRSENTVDNFVMGKCRFGLD